MGQTAGADTNSFTVAVRDGLATTTTTVSVPVLPGDLAPPMTAAAAVFSPTGWPCWGICSTPRSGQDLHRVLLLDTTTNTVVKTIAVG